jgi:hypothetical protein
MTTDGPPIATAPAPRARVPTSGGETRIDLLKGDRCCAKCGFNLHGQTIIREPHYDMLIVRCPECGTAAALQEYPTLTRMAWRLRMVLAAAWLGAMLLGMLFTGLILAALSEATATNVTQPYSNFANTEFTDWTQRNATSAVNNNTNNWWTGNTQLQQWWDGYPPPKLFADFGGWSKLNWRGLFFWIYVAFAFIPIGAVWSVVFARLRGVRLAAILCLIPAITALIYGITLADWPSAFFVYSAHQLVEQQIAWLPTLMTVAVGGLCLIIGALIGRPIARAFLRFTLPARLLAAFSFLWIVDGKPLPKPTPPKSPL